VTAVTTLRSVIDVTMSADRSVSAVSTTVMLGIAAVAMALIAIFGQEGTFTPTTVVAALVGLLPWALVVGGVELRPWLFALLAYIPAAFIVVVDENPGGMFPLMLLVVWIARMSASRLLIGATVVASGATIVALAIEQGSIHENGCLYFLGGLGISWLAGVMLRRQELLLAEVEAMNAQRVAQLAAAERTRIAREVHDVVAHSLTIVMLNLTGARRALATHPEEAEAALAQAERVGRESLDSIRQVIGLLREPGTDPGLPPPTLAALPALIQGYRSAGHAVSAEIDPRLQETVIDPTVQLVLYRVIQESLANVAQHAPAAASTVVAVLEPTQVVVEITNGKATSPPVTGSGSRTGLGVRGMTERVRAVGGDLRAGPIDGGGWSVTAAVPLRTASPAGRDEVTWATQSG
jgi:signal transduction histidine kinase